MSINKCKVCYYSQNEYYCSKHRASISKSYTYYKYINPDKCIDFIGIKQMRIIKINEELKLVRKQKREILKQEELLVNERQELKDQLKKYKNKLKMYKEL